MTSTRSVDRGRLASLMADESRRFADEHRRSAELHARALESLLEGVPMRWMVKWAGPFPLFVESASGASFRGVDGHEYVDFCLGDTGAMAGHGPAPTIAAVERQTAPGITHMLPTEDAAWVGEELARRFGLPLVAVRAVGDRREPLLAPPRTPHQRPFQGRRARPLLPRVGGRGDRRAGRGRRRRRPPGRRAAGGRRRRRGSSSSTTWPALEPALAYRRRRRAC